MGKARLSARYDNDEGLEDFQDAVDDFPFYDSEETFSDSGELNTDVSISSSLNAKRLNEDKSTIASGLRRRRSLPLRNLRHGNSSELSRIGSEENSEKLSNYRENELPSFSKIKGCEKKVEDGNENSGIVEADNSLGSANEIKNADEAEKNDETETTTLTDANNDGLDFRENDGASSSLLLLLVGVIVKAIVFQIGLFCKFLMFPVWSLYKLYMFIHDPFGFSKQVRGCLLRKMKRIWSFTVKNVSPFVYEWLKEHNDWWRLGLKCAWGLLWACYVCVVLVGLLVSAFVIGGLFVRIVVEEPVRIKRDLNFDYTEKSPMALTPLLESKGPSHDMYLEEMPGLVAKSGWSRVIPPNHKLKVTLTLTLPESDYNQNLGIFQVRVDFVTADGKLLASSRRPCMLQYRSQPIKLLLTFFKAAPILTGYTSETQKVKINFRGFTESETPTASLRVTIEPRAEYLPGAGIPEMYSASLKLESELPLLKRLIWYWKMTLFIWFGLVIFTFELGFALLCCKPLIIPRIRLRRSDDRGTSHSAL